MEKNKSSYYTFMKSPKWRTQSERIKRRDGYTCQLCGVKNIPVEAHHIKYLDDFSQVPDNDIITLCVDCHQNLHYAKIELKNRLAEVYDYHLISNVVNQLKQKSKEPAKKENKVINFLKRILKW